MHILQDFSGQDAVPHPVSMPVEIDSTVILTYVTAMMSAAVAHFSDLSSWQAVARVLVVLAVGII